MSTTIETPPPELEAHHVGDRRLTLLSVVLVLGAITTILDTTIVNVALKHLHDVFHASVADTQWVSSGYLLALAGVIPLSGWAAERFGARRVWMAAVALFMVGSALCGTAWNLPSLVGFRVLQGIGGGLVLPVTMTILTQAAGPSRLNRALAAIMIPAQLAPILGPVVGGTIIDSVSWHWLFFVNVPICLVALVLAPRFIPPTHGAPDVALDVRGLTLLTPGLVALAFGISKAGSGGFGATRSWLPMVVGVALLSAFVGHALRTTRTPLVDVRPFARRSFGLASVVTFVGGFSSFAVMFLLPLFYQDVRGESAFRTGLLLIPQGLGTIAFALLNRGALARVETRFVVTAGIVLTSVSVIPFALADATTGGALLLVSQFVQGLGMGAVLLPVMTVAFASLSRAEVPRASAAFSVVQRVGAPFGVTVVAVLLQSLLTSAAPTPAGIAAAFATTFWWVIAFSAVPLLVAFFLPTQDARPASAAAPAPAHGDGL